MARDYMIESELRDIAQQNGGILRARDVVQKAQDPDTALHSQFDWDDTRAAARWRLHQARRLIRVLVEVVPAQQRQVQARIYWSLGPDRSANGGGYRTLRTVLEVRQLRTQLLSDALAELQHFQLKYAHLSELSEVFEAIEKTAQPQQPQGPSTHRKQPGRAGRPRKSDPAGQRAMAMAR